MIDYPSARNPSSGNSSPANPARRSGSVLLSLLWHLGRLSWWLIVPGALALLVTWREADSLNLWALVSALFVVAWGRAYLSSGQADFLVTICCTVLGFGLGFAVFSGPQVVIGSTADRVVYQVDERTDRTCRGTNLTNNEAVTWSGQGCYGRPGTRIQMYENGLLQQHPTHVVPGLQSAAKVALVIWGLGFPLKTATMWLQWRRAAGGRRATARSGPDDGSGTTQRQESVDMNMTR